jgi:hypothetical protein
MKHQKKNILRELAKHFGIKVKFVHHLPNDIHGVLLPREKRILINAHKPRVEHVYTLLHEIGHWVVHFSKTVRLKPPRYLEIHWRIEGVALFFSKVRRTLRYFLNKESGKEWTADLWALCTFIYLAKHLGYRDDLTNFLYRHPEKMSLFYLAAFGLFFGNAKARVHKMSKVLLLPFRRTTRPH